MKPPFGLLIKLSADICAATGIIAALIGFRYLSGFDIPEEPLGIVYTVIAVIGHFFQIGLILWIISLPLILALPRVIIIRPIIITLAALILAALLLDSLVFTAHRFHFTPLTITILGTRTWLFGIFYFIIGWILLFRLSDIFKKRILQKRATLPVRILCVITVLFFFMTHILNAWADANYYTPITSLSSQLPVFYPATAKRFMKDHNLVDLEKARKRQMLAEIETGSARGDLAYPLRPLHFVNPQKRYNILVILVDELRADIFTPERAPRLSAWAANHTTFTNHSSGGNSTRMGCFSLFYGLPSTYWQAFDSRQISPVLMTRLKELSYSFGIFSSAPLYAPASLDRTVFHGISTPDPDEGKVPYARDSAITDNWKKWLDTIAVSQNPFFGFLFYDALCTQKTQNKFAGYLNSLLYVDSLAGEILDDLARRKLDSSTIIILTADHGEEFNELNNGIHGHGSGYGTAQLQVPLVIAWPGITPQTLSKRTSHFDIAPTIISKALGCTDSGALYSSGNDLFSSKGWEWIIAGSYFNYAVVEAMQMTVAYPNGFYEVRDRNFGLIRDPEINTQALKAAYAEIGKFYKK